MDKIILTYPIYYKIFEKYFTKGENVSWQLNRIYQPIFIGLIEYYSEFMNGGIKNIINEINSRYKPQSPHAIIDYIEYLFGNILYDTFITEIKKIDNDSIRYEHLCIFEYIIGVELIKYELYLETLNKLESNSKIIIPMKNRMEFCIGKISFCLGYLDKYYSKYKDVIYLCKDLISKSVYSIEDKIDTNIINKVDSFIQINKK